LLHAGKWLMEGHEVDEDALEDLPELERLQEEDELLERLTTAETLEELRAEIDLLDHLIPLAKEAERHGTETKLARLKEVLNDRTLRQQGEKILVFTEARDTLDYLVEKLRDWGYSVVTIHGAMNLDQRIQAEHDFKEKAQVMVSTEAGGEGINLQFCSLMVNYDIPWNPNRLEQRMGRIHRYLQQNEVHIYNLVAHDTREGQVMTALFRKLERIREAYGSDRVFDVIGDLLPGANLRDLIVEAIAKRRSLDEIIAELERVPDAEAIQRMREALMEGLATRHIDLQSVLDDTRQAKEQRLVPEYVEHFFQRACGFLGVPLERRQDGLWRIERVPYEIRNISPEFKQRFGTVFAEYLSFSFDKETAKRARAEFVAPGHPLLETVIEAILARATDDLRRGAVFTDPDGRLNGLLWFLEGEIRDGANAIAGKRLLALYQPAAGRDGPPVGSIPPAILWDLTPGAEASPVPAGPPPEQDAVIEVAMAQVLDPYKEELQKQREQAAEIKRKYGLRSLKKQRMESEAKLVDYETRRAKGEAIPEATIKNEERVKEDLEKKIRRLEEAIRLETTLAPAPPRILGVARIIPQAMPGAEMYSDPEVEAIAMEQALAYERAHGRQPEDVSPQNLGYDLRSQGPDKAIRYIEVKGRAASGPVVLTTNEWLMAQRLGQDYWLYVVEHCRSPRPRLNPIPNPAAVLRPEKLVEVRYLIKDWKGQASHEGTVD
jgi:hypothetical protein